MAVTYGGTLQPRGVSDRTFAIALAASLLVHAFLLLAAPWLIDPSRKRQSTPPIVAHLVPSQPAPTPPPAVEPRIEPKVEQVPRAVRKSTQAPSERPALPLPPVIAAPELQAPTAAETPRALESAAPPAVVAAPPTRPGPAAPAPTSIAVDAFDPATLGQYRIAIIAAAKRYKKYPRLAMDNNWEGQAEIRMVIGADGTIASISVKTRSGFEVLDEQAMEMIRKAKPLAPIPPQLRGKGFTVDVPVVFSLKEETG